MSKLFDWLGVALGDGYQPSTTRLIAFLCIPFSVILPLTVWACLCFYYKLLLDFPPSVAGFIVSVDTLILGTLHINKREETKIEIQ